MERLCIYLTYNKEKKIHEYIGRALQALKACGVKLCLVCNYDQIVEGKACAAACADWIFYRENKGYDSGAYKDVICSYLGWEEVGKYDEVILANDSFFGFFYPLQDTFRLMEETDCDFWGITGQGPGEYQNPYRAFDAYIHSYFMAFRENVVKSEVFRSFWEELAYARNFREAIEGFELSVNERLKESGFVGKSCIDHLGIRLEYNENPYYSMPDRLVLEYRVPVLKKKCLLVRTAGFGHTLGLLGSLGEKQMYPVEWITPYLEGQFYIPGQGEEGSNSLEAFYRAHREIYIYGAGVCGKNLGHYFAYKGWKYKGHIVTDKGRAEIPVLSLEEAETGPDTGIIISVLDGAVSAEIAAHIGKRCSREQLFFISDCPAVRLPE